MKRLHGVGLAAAGGFIQWHVGAGGPNLAVVQLPLAAGVLTDLDREEWLVLNAGDTLAWQVNVGTAANLGASGTELAL